MDPFSLGWLFIDMNAYFASVEQEFQPGLRGRPVAIIPVDAVTTCCIAVSYEARAYGVRTGMNVGKALGLCPHLRTVVARPKFYVQVHQQIRAAIESQLPVHAVLSCDEFCCELMGKERAVAQAVELAKQIKQAVRRVGATLRCSIGVGPNRLIAKIGAGMHKPDGLNVIERHQLPDALHTLELSDVPGIGRRMEPRLGKAGISSVQQLCALSRQAMASIWGGVPGERLWLELRGENLPEAASEPLKTISRQHILPPHQRTRDGCRQIALKMLHDCIRRLRKQNLWAGGLGLAIYHLNHRYVFEAHCPVSPCQDPFTLQNAFLSLWEGSPRQTPASLCVFLTDLCLHPAKELFPAAGSDSRVTVSLAIDRIQQRFGKNAIYLASVHGALEEAPTRISFGPPPELDEF